MLQKPKPKKEKPYESNAIMMIAVFGIRYGRMQNDKLDGDSSDTM